MSDIEIPINEGDKLTVVHEECGEEIATISIDHGVVDVSVQADHSNCGEEQEE